MADITDITGLISEIIVYFKNGYCSATISGDDATTCGSGAGGLAVVILSFLVIVALPLLKDLVTKGLHQRRMGLVSIVAVLVLASGLPSTYAVVVAAVLVILWAIFAIPFSRYTVSFRVLSTTLDNLVILSAPIAYLLVWGMQWGAEKIQGPGPTVFFLVPSTLGQADQRFNLQTAIIKLRSSLTDMIAPQLYAVMPPPKLIGDFDDYYKRFAVGWNDLAHLPNQDAKLRNRKITFIRPEVSGASYADGNGWLRIDAEARSFNPATEHISLTTEASSSILGIQKNFNADLMVTLLSLPIIEHYATGNSAIEAQLSAAYASELATDGKEFQPSLASDIQQKLNSGCSTFDCVDSIAKALRDAVNTEYQNAKQDWANQAVTNMKSQAVQASFNVTGNLQ